MRSEPEFATGLQHLWQSFKFANKFKHIFSPIILLDEKIYLVN